MANNIEAFCSNCKEETLHLAYVEGWRCDDCGRINYDIYVNPYPDNDY